jgi:hypothetical protein
MKKRLRNILIIILIVVIFSLPLFIKVKADCRSQEGSCPTEINSKLDAVKNKNLFQAKRDTSKIMKASFLVSDFSMQFKLPNTILVNTIIKKPEYSILDKGSGKYYMLDEKGVVLSMDEKTRYVILIKDAPNLGLGQKVSNEDLFALKLIYGVNQMYQIPSGAVQGESLAVELPQGIRVIFPMKDAEVEVLLGSLRLIYNKITTDYPGVYSQIDMRYKNPILR